MTERERERASPIKLEVGAIGREDLLPARESSVLHVPVLVVTVTAVPHEEAAVHAHSALYHIFQQFLLHRWVDV